MNRVKVLALIALIPAAFNVTAATAGTIMVPLCTGDGQVHMVPIPGAPQLPGENPGSCCVKGCHAGSCRKKSQREFEPSQ